MTTKQLSDAAAAATEAIINSTGARAAAVLVILDLERPGAFTLASTDPFLTRDVLEAALRSLTRTPDSHEIRSVSVEVDGGTKH